MPRLSRFQVMQHMKPQIAKYFKEQGPKVYSQGDLDNILREYKPIWCLPLITRGEDFSEFLVDKNILNKVKIKLPQKNIEKYTYGDITEYEVALSLRYKAYLCHYTAMFIHNITENIPKNIYTNAEQIDKGSPDRNSLEQTNIDRAFSRPMRQTNQIAELEAKKIYLLNGKNINRVGVIDLPFNGRTIQITSIERTLIDITVRPAYAGGVEEVLNAYIAAKDQFSVNKLVSILKKMNYTYPYHQAIGFYLERAGYKENVIKLLEKMDIKYNFYLTYEMKDKDFSDRWKLFFPKGF